MRTLVTYAVLIGLTPLIPIPLLDDLVQGFFARSLVHSLAYAAGLSLSDAEIAALAEERRGCLTGCLLGTVEYLVKRLVRKIIFILEWRRAVDLATHSYYTGRLLAHAFSQGWYEPGDAGRAARLRAAVEAARAGANMSLVRQVVGRTFSQSRALVVSAVGQMADSVKDLAGRRRGAAGVEAAVAQRLEREAPQIKMTLGDLIERMQVNLSALPDDHFDALESRLEAAVKSER
jgi:hypothetical protein